MGLEHTFRLLDFINNPHRNLKIIHIAGTNGKGSTAAVIYGVLKARGYKVGLYTSPHLINFNERIRINGLPISDQEILLFMRQLEPAIQEIKSTFFEVTTAMALNHFNDNNVDVAIIETGLGGRLDSTNVVDPSLTVMTPISIDHIDILGHTIEEIATEKAGIIKKKVPLITAMQNKSVFEILKKTANKNDSPIYTSSDPTNVEVMPRGTGFEYSGKKFITSMIGEHQASNAALAINALMRFDDKIPYETLCEGLKNVFWPGRLQLVSDRIYYDVAHNKAGIKSVLKTLNIIFPESEFFGLFCLKGDKDIEPIAKYIKSQFKTLFITTSKDGLLLRTRELSEKLNILGIDNVSVDSISNGIKKIKKLMKPKDIALIFGTHYIASEIFYEFEISFDSGVI